MRKFRITRADERNLQIEEYRLINRKKGEPTEDWVWVGYYPKIEDTIPDLINLLLEIPDVALAEQVASLAVQLKAVKAEIVEIVRGME